MNTTDGPYVFDTGPLSHFSKAGWLGLLGAVVADRGAWVPDVVEMELRAGTKAHPHLHGVLTAKWLTLHPVESTAELRAFGRFSRRLVGADGRNLGECGVLALAQVHSGVAILDDRAARTVAGEFGVRLRGSVGLLLELVQDGEVSPDLASQVADDLLRSEYRLPFEEGGFIAWARANNLLSDSS